MGELLQRSEVDGDTREGFWKSFLYIALLVVTCVVIYHVGYFIHRNTKRAETLEIIGKYIKDEQHEINGKIYTNEIYLVRTDRGVYAIRVNPFQAWTMANPEILYNQLKEDTVVCAEVTGTRIPFLLRPSLYDVKHQGECSEKP